MSSRVEGKREKDEERRNGISRDLKLAITLGCARGRREHSGSSWSVLGVTRVVGDEGGEGRGVCVPC